MTTAAPRDRPRPPIRARQALHRFGLVFAYLVQTGAERRPLGWKDLDGRPPEGALHWIHLDLRHAATQRWLEHRSGIDPLLAEVMSAKTVHPTWMLHGQNMLLILKGVNFQPGSPPGDMISLRIFCDGRRLVTCRRERIQAIDQYRQRVLQSSDPLTPGAMIAELADMLVSPMDAIVTDLLDQTHAIGHAGDRGNTENMVATLAHLRRSMIRFRSHLSRQRRVLAELGRSRLTWFEDGERRAIVRLAAQLNQHVEAIDAAAEITEITQDEILQRSSERTERRLFSLTLITAIFLPLTFITGLLGVNLAGIPDANDPVAFLLLCLMLGALVVLQLWYLRKKGWL